MITISFRDIKNRPCEIRIDNGQDDIVMTPSVNPFVTAEDDDNDIFKPIRTQTGTIGLMCEVGDLNAVIGANPLQRPVTFLCNNSEAWKGFLQSDAYTQVWDAGANEIDLPIISGLGMLETLTPLWSENEQYGFITFAELIAEINTRLGNIYQFAYFPARNNPTTTLGYSFLRLNYMTLDSEDMKDGKSDADAWRNDKFKYNCESYKKILEDVCVLFGWSLQERGNTLYFMAHDCEHRYIKFDLDDIATLEEIADFSVTPVSEETFDASIFGAAHNITYNAGKKSVKVTNKTNNAYEDLFSLRFDDFRFASSDESVKRTGTQETTYYYTRNYANNKQLLARNNDIGNIRFANYTNPTPAGTQGAWGGSINNEGALIVNIDNASETGDGQLTNRIIMHGESEISNTQAVSIKLLPYMRDAFGWQPQIYLTGNIQVVSDTRGEWQPYTGHLYYGIQNSNGLFYNSDTNTWERALRNAQTMYVRNGVITDQTGLNKQTSLVRGYAGVTLFPFGATFPSGIYFIHIYTPANKTQYYSITNLAIKRAFDWKYTGVRGEYPEDNAVTYQLNNGFSEEWSAESGLALGNRWSNLLAGYYQSLQIGKGIVQHIATLVDNLGVGISPEIDLANRARSYYNATRKKVVAKMDITTFDADPMKQYAVTDQDYFSVAGMSTNWRECESEITLIETTLQF